MSENEKIVRYIGGIILLVAATLGLAYVIRGIGNSIPNMIMILIYIFPMTVCCVIGVKLLTPGGNGNKNIKQ